VSNQQDVNVHDETATGEAAEDARLVRLVLDGTTDAFDRLVRRHERKAVSVSYRFVGNIEDAKEVTQDALLRAYRKLGQLEQPERFGPWLMRIVANLSLNFRRSRQASFGVQLEGEAFTALAARDDRVGRAPAPPDQTTAASELSAAVTQAMHQLPEKQRTALILSSIEKLPQKDVAEIMDCTVELVKWNVFQARKAMKSMLSPFIFAESDDRAT